MTIENVKQIIKDSQLNADLKKRLLVLLPRLRKYTLAGLGREISRGDVLIIAEYLAGLWENFANFIESFEHKNQSAIQGFKNFFNSHLNRFNGEDEFYFLNFVLDMRLMTVSNQARITYQQYQQLLDFETKMFWYLPKEEILFLLQNNLLFLLKKINPLEDIQYVIYRNDWDFPENANKIFLDALLANKEEIGSKYPKTVGNWLKDYLNFSIPAGSQANTFGVTSFMLKDASVQKLTDDEKNLLAQIIKLYAWFLKPEISEEQILAYKEKVDEQRFHEILSEEQDPYLSVQKSQLPSQFYKSQAAVVIPSLNLQQRNNQPNVNIDEKLDELKKRVDEK